MNIKYSNGHHVVTKGKVIASGTASIEAYGNAVVRAYDNAKVTAHDNVRVYAFCASMVDAYDDVRVVAGTKAVVNVHDNAKVRIEKKKETVQPKIPSVMVTLRSNGREWQVSKRDLLEDIASIADDNIARGCLHGMSDDELAHYESEFDCYRSALCAHIKKQMADGNACVLDIDNKTDMPTVPGFEWHE